MKMGAGIEDLPETLLMHILSFIPACDLVHSVSQVSPLWAQLCSNRYVWLNKEYVVDEAMKSDFSDEHLAVELSHLPLGPRRIVLRRPVRPILLNVITGEATVSVSLHAHQQMSAQDLDTLLSNCPQLTELCLPTSLLKRPDCIAVIVSATNKQLKSLAVADDNSDHTLDLGPFSGYFPNLHTLSVRQVTCKPEGLKAFLATTNQLKMLSLRNMGQSGIPLLPMILPFCEALKKLNVCMERTKSYQVTESFFAVGQMNFITHLTIEDAPGHLSEGLQAAFSGDGLRELKTVCLKNVSAVSAPSLAALVRGRPKLQYLDISRSPWLKDSDIEGGLGATKPEPLTLLALNLSFCNKLTDVSIKEVAQICPQLEELQLRADLRLVQNALESVGELINLKTLDISRCYRLTEWWHPLLKLQQLQWLELSYLELNPMSLEQLVIQHKDLYYLGLRYCSGATKTLCEKLLSINPRLQITTEFLPSSD